MTSFQQAAAAVVAGPAWRRRFGKACPIWSFDNDRIHTHVATLASLKINKCNRLPSPDIHGVVERCIGRLKEQFQSWLYRHPAQRSMAEYQAAMRDIFFHNKKVAIPAVIDSQVQDMHGVYAAIASPAVRGGRPPKKFL